MICKKLTKIQEGRGDSRPFFIDFEDLPEYVSVFSELEQKGYLVSTEYQTIGRIFQIEGLLIKVLGCHQADDGSNCFCLDLEGHAKDPLQ